ncbi:MAG TPA: hypothetical protein VN666_22040 [Nitrospira sp.]|nr:hypothetical protein [Nitrospira sp.]
MESVKVEKRGISIDEAIEELREIFKELQDNPDTHDTWDWLNADFYVEVMHTCYLTEQRRAEEAEESHKYFVELASKHRDELDAQVADLTAQLQRAREALQGVKDLIGDSQGVAGFHLNGDIAEWGEFDVVNQIDAALTEVPK